MTQTDNAVWIAPKALDVLKAELADAEGPRWDEIVARIAQARDEGDLKENGGYHAAREEQGKLKAWIDQLKYWLDNADSTTPEDDDIVAPGKLITTDPEFTDKNPFLLATDIVDGAYDDEELVSPESPFGSTLMGAKKGDTIDYTAPNGKTFRITIADVSVYA